tara:strand:- start:324 stop:956 length:633 start_codon:yes stop_codon:yes gene_type:complete
MMAKRFTDTAKWSEDWFLEIKNPHKLFWIYVCDNCNHAGIFKPNKRMFELILGARIDINMFLEEINSDKQRILELANGKWYLTKFIEFQYGGKLNENNRVHKSILEILIANNITWEEKSIVPQLEVKDYKPKVNSNIPSTINEVIDYFKLKGSSKIEGEKFYYFYESKDWLVGKTKMKNWKMSASGWIARNKKDLPDSDYLGGQLEAMKS